MNVKKRKNAFGTHTIAGICEVSPPTVARWISEGKLPSFTTGGGHRRVRANDLVAFLKAHNMTVPADLRADGPTRILIVDDDEIVRKYVARVVSGVCPDAEIHEARDGFEAGHKLMLLVPSLVVLDLRMPGANGIQVCELIRQSELLKKTRVLAVTGYAAEESRRAMMAAGADAFLEKPFEPAALAREIRQLLDVAQPAQAGGQKS